MVVASLGSWPSVHLPKDGRLFLPLGSRYSGRGAQPAGNGDGRVFLDIGFQSQTAVQQ
jgi:hypothetical protein